MATSKRLKSLPGVFKSRAKLLQDPIDPALLPPIVPNRFVDLYPGPDGILPIADLANDVIVVIPRPSTIIVAGDNLALFWGLLDTPFQGMEEVSRYVFVPGDVTSNADFELTLPSRVFPAPNSGVTTRFQIIYAGLTAGAENPTSCAPLAITIDYEAPGGTNLVQLRFDEQVGDTVTPADLVSGALASVVPDYYGMADGDVIMPWIGQGNPAGGGQLLPLSEWVYIGSAEVSKDVQLPFKEEYLAALGDGIQAFSFQLKDKAGNISAVAPPVYFNVILHDTPENLLPPVVPLYVANGLITDADSRSGIDVEVPPYSNIHPGDSIVINWGNQHSDPYPVGDITVVPLLTVTLPYLLILTEGSGIKQVSYTVLRGTVELDTSPSTQVNVDLAIPGGPDPIPETPENENLLALIVTSFTGVIDSIPAADYDKDAQVTIPWRDKNGVEYLEVGDRIRIYWGPNFPVDKTVTQADFTAGVDLNLLMSAQIIGQTGAGIVPVSYAVSRSLDGLHFGVSFSPKKDVPVASSADVPGGGQGLALPDFPERNQNNYINRAAAISNQGTPLQFRVDYANGGVGDTLTWKFEGRLGYDGLGAVIPNSTLTGTHIVVQEDLDRGYVEVIIPTPTLFIICDLAAGIASYTANNGVGPVTSPEQLVLVSVRAIGPGTTGCEWPIPNP